MFGAELSDDFISFHITIQNYANLLLVISCLVQFSTSHHQRAHHVITHNDLLYTQKTHIVVDSPSITQQQQEEGKR